jgi:Na+/melibiose symporter-like transporter
MKYVGCFLLGLAAGLIGMWSSQHWDKIACFLLGIIWGIIMIFAFMWLLAGTLKRNIQEEQERADEWWKKGEPPPWEK